MVDTLVLYMFNLRMVEKKTETKTKNFYTQLLWIIYSILKSSFLLLDPLDRISP